MDSLSKRGRLVPNSWFKLVTYANFKNPPSLGKCTVIISDWAWGQEVGAGGRRAFIQTSVEYWTRAVGFRGPPSDALRWFKQSSHPILVCSFHSVFSPERLEGNDASELHCSFYGISLPLLQKFQKQVSLGLYFSSLNLRGQTHFSHFFLTTSVVT